MGLLPQGGSTVRDDGDGFLPPVLVDVSPALKWILASRRDFLYVRQPSAPGEQKT
ncbi:MAG TPA: hypothetical protein VNZ64_04980 [Candidatus Acidoferrum sp.]|nr:hypothetical protein [Candidatus Acidoferrum sp.]